MPGRQRLVAVRDVAPEGGVVAAFEIDRCVDRAGAERARGHHHVLDAARQMRLGVPDGARFQGHHVEIAPGVRADRRRAASR